MKIAGILAGKGTFVATVASTTPIVGMLAELARHAIGAVVVVDDGVIQGVASERDVVRALHDEGPSILDRPVGSIMTDMVATCGAHSTIEELAVAMTENRVRHVPVLGDDGSLIGIVSIGDVVKARIDQLEHERRHLIQYITS